MTVRRLLLLKPIADLIFLRQPYFWVPTYEKQTQGNPYRLKEYISASSQDASILNPILHSDAPSGDIVDLVFERLLDRDEDGYWSPSLHYSNTPVLHYSGFASRAMNFKSI